jgi:hypothetical protein
MNLEAKADGKPNGRGNVVKNFSQLLDIVLYALRITFCRAKGSRQVCIHFVGCTRHTINAPGGQGMTQQRQQKHGYNAQLFNHISKACKVQEFVTRHSEDSLYN